MFCKNKKKRKQTIIKYFIILFSSILIIIGSTLIVNKHYSNFIENKNDEKEVELFFEKQTSTISIEVKEDLEKNNKNETKDNTSEKYIAVLEIPEINLKRGIYDKHSKLNHVSKNIQFLESSDYPNKEKGNFILAAHNGNSKASFFKNLHKLELTDVAYVYYNNEKYIYKLVNIYEVEKTGKVEIVRDSNESNMTLITCKRNSNKQIVLIFKLIK